MLVRSRRHRQTPVRVYRVVKEPYSIVAQLAEGCCSETFVSPRSALSFHSAIAARGLRRAGDITADVSNNLPNCGLVCVVTSSLGRYSEVNRARETYARQEETTRTAGQDSAAAQGYSSTLYFHS